MNIVVVNGSPKGKNSFTFQSVRYLEKKYPDIHFETYHVGQTIKSYRSDNEKMEKFLMAVQSCDAILWVYPVYTCLVPFQLVQFVSYLYENSFSDVVKGKYAAQISTSKHFYDYTAYNYLHQVSEDLNLQHVPGIMQGMEDLLKETGQVQLTNFFERYLDTILNRKAVSRKYQTTKTDIMKVYRGDKVKAAQIKPETHKKVVLLTDATQEDVSLNNMITAYINSMPQPVEVINLHDQNLTGGCLGCFHCAIEGNCIYKDGFETIHREKIQKADCLILAGTISQHWFKPIWKCYDDRLFYNGHRTSMMGKSIGYLISGSLRDEHNFREVLEARSEVGQLYLLDIISDEDDDHTITALIHGMAEKTMWALENKPVRPQNFYGVGGMKVFRDLIFVMRGLMKEDHRFYKKNGLYDFPQKEVKQILLMNFVGLLMIFKRFRKNAQKSINRFMLKPYEAVINKLGY